MRLFRQSAQPRADVQPASGLRTLTRALAGAVSLKRGSGRSATTSSAFSAGQVTGEVAHYQIHLGLSRVTGRARGLLPITLCAGAALAGACEDVDVIRPQRQTLPGLDR